MTALHDRRARLLASLYAKFGETAGWTAPGGGAAVPVTVRRRGEDLDLGFGESAALVRKDLLRVRNSEVAAPAEGDTVAIDAAAGGVETVRVIAAPRLAPNGLEWVCEVAPPRAA